MRVVVALHSLLGIGQSFRSPHKRLRHIYSFGADELPQPYLILLGINGQLVVDGKAWILPMVDEVRRVVQRSMKTRIICECVHGQRTWPCALTFSRQHPQQLVEALHVPLNKSIGLLMVRQGTGMLNSPLSAEVVEGPFKLGAFVRYDRLGRAEDAQQMLVDLMGHKRCSLIPEGNKDDVLSKMVLNNQDVPFVVLPTWERTLQIHSNS
jgi:hypothetical protein